MVECVTCDDTGYVCEVCNQTDEHCTCANGPHLVACDDCSDIGDDEGVDDDERADLDDEFL